MNKPLMALLLVLPAIGLAQSPVEYEISFDNAVHHEAQIKVTWHDLDDAVLQARMSRSSPGRYAIHEFAKNVYAVEAVDGAGNTLAVTRPNPYQWNVSGHDGSVTMTYTLYADRAGGTYSGIDLTHAHLNMPATFMWARGLDERPAEIAFFPTDPDWKVATQLVPTGDPFVFTAPDLQYFMDSPTELSDFSERSWQVSGNGETYTIRLLVHHDGLESEVDAYLEKAQRVVDQQIEVFGEPPDFDYGSYTFIADYLPHVARDGMEHRNSTILTDTRSLPEARFAQLGTLSHEFIHAWNAERLRPADLEPFDFERANMSDNLWFVEGFTSYYGPLTILRAGESTPREFLDTLSSYINTVANSPGRAFASPVGMSIRAPFVDAATAIDPTNFDNTFISYYTYGAALGLALDLALREGFDDLDLDAYMRRLWQRFGRSEQPYTTADLHAALAEVTGDPDFAGEFFERYIHGRELPDYESLLSAAGVLLRRADLGASTAGPVTLTFNGNAAMIDDNTLIGTPLYQAGLDRGDEIIALGRLAIDEAGDWEDAVARYSPGETATIRYRQRGSVRTAELVFAEDPALEAVFYEDAGLETSEAQRALRRDWLGTEVAN